MAGPDRPARVGGGLITGWHDASTSHPLVLEVVAGSDLAAAAYQQAVDHGYRWHELAMARCCRSEKMGGSNGGLRTRAADTRQAWRLGMAAFCGRIQAQRDSVFGLPELSLGLILGAGGTVSATQRVDVSAQRIWLLQVRSSIRRQRCGRDWSMP
ncbi:hypothetical protein [Mycobacterium sp. SM1]|uniref:hypothetical protein n=1 Tax=Mycobacterium sp. SM1 TaxID=2816243 RepID=UPI0035A9884B